MGRMPEDRAGPGLPEERLQRPISSLPDVLSDSTRVQDELRLPGTLLKAPLQPEAGPRDKHFTDITTRTRGAGTKPRSPRSPKAVSGHSLEALSTPRGAQSHFKTMYQAKALLLCRPPGRCRKRGPCVSVWGTRGGQPSGRRECRAGRAREAEQGSGALTKELARLPAAPFQQSKGEERGGRSAGHRPCGCGHTLPASTQISTGSS